MFIGHYSAAIAAKGLSPKTPFWLFILAAQLVDIVWAVLIALGIEKLRFDESLASNPLDLYYMPFTHSLLATFAWMGLAYLLLRSFARSVLSPAQSALVALVVGSHWLLDLLVHRPDLTIAGGEKFGLGLWNLPVIALALEFLLVAIATGYLLWRHAGQRRQQGCFVVFATLLVAVQLASSFGVAPANIAALSASALLTFLVLTAVAWWLERVASRADG